MQLSLIFDKPKKVKVAKVKEPELTKAEKFKLSVENYFKLSVHQRINIRTWMQFCSLRIFHEQVDCSPDYRPKFYEEHYEYSWRWGHRPNEDYKQYGINQYTS